MLTKPASVLSEKAVTVGNRTDLEIDLPRIVILVKFLKGELGIDETTSVDVTFVNQAVMSELHIRYMGLSGPTDVLSFPATVVVEGPFDPTSVRDQPMLGDIVICPDFIKSNTRSEPTQMNIDACVIHAMLHLIGRNHESPASTKLMSSSQRFLERVWARTHLREGR